MALGTKNAIRCSFMELLAERPFDKISVRDIAERSGVTRNTFYYYYADIYALVEDIFEFEIIGRMGNSESLQKASLSLIDFAVQNKRAILHLYDSTHRSTIEHCYHKTILSGMLSYMEKEAAGIDISKSRVVALARFYTAALTGLTADWLRNGMKETSDTLLADLVNMLDGNIRASLEYGAQCKY